MKQNCQKLRGVCVTDHIFGRSITIDSTTKMPSVGWWQQSTARPSTPVFTATNCVWGSTWTVWIAVLENTWRYLFMWCREIMTAFWNGPLREELLCPFWISLMALNTVTTSVRPWWPSLTCWLSKDPQHRSTTWGMDMLSLHRLRRSASRSMSGIIPCWCGFKFFTNCVVLLKTVVSEFQWMNELPVIRSLRLRSDFWDRHGANIATRWKGMYGGRLFRRPKWEVWVFVRITMKCVLK